MNTESWKMNSLQKLPTNLSSFFSDAKIRNSPKFRQKWKWIPYPHVAGRETCVFFKG